MSAEELDAFGVASVPSGLWVTVAAKLYARTGEWPWWFVRVVGEDVPPAYLGLALHYRQQLEQDLGIALPVVRAKAAALKSPMRQLGIEGVEEPGRTKARSRRGAA